jgi:hypothetical protein
MNNRLFWGLNYKFFLNFIETVKYFMRKIFFFWLISKKYITLQY